MGELTDKVKGAVNDLVGNAKQAAARATDDPSLDAEGKAQEGKGEVQKGVGTLKGALGDRV